jgi:cytosine/adenosine deaminase-related metal-dependent hydrolase
MAYRLAERLDVLVHFHIAETAHEVQEFRRQHGQDLVPRSTRRASWGRA